MKPVILIPAYKPRSEILTIVRELLRLDISSILVVNDGSGENFRVLFDHLAEMAGVDVVHHADNQGKGAALRTGFRLIMEKNPDAPGVVTVDADGQHLPGDVAKVTRSLVSNPRTLILGCRRFDGETPLKSAIGNHCTRLIYEIATGARITDTQTGLRGIPSDVLPLLVKLPSERYAYELDMLLTLHGERYPFLETDIRTVYDGNNESTHFRPAVDSFRVYRVLFSWLFKLRLAKILNYSLSSILSTLVDFGVYAALIYLASATIAGASITARIASVVTHFLVNKYFTFSHRNAPGFAEIVKYLGVAAFNLFFSIILIEFFVKAFLVEKVLAKVLAQSILFLLTYFLLSRFVFPIRGKH